MLSSSPDLPLVPLDHRTQSRFDENLHHLGRDIANSSGIGAIGTDLNPGSDGTQGLCPVFVVDDQEADNVEPLESRAPEIVSSEQSAKPRNDGGPPDFVVGRVAYIEGGLASELGELFPALRHAKTVGVEVGAPHELGRVVGVAVIVEIAFVLGDQIGSDDGGVVREATLLIGEGGGIAQSGRVWGRQEGERLERISLISVCASLEGVL